MHGITLKKKQYKTFEIQYNIDKNYTTIEIKRITKKSDKGCIHNNRRALAATEYRRKK